MFSTSSRTGALRSLRIGELLLAFGPGNMGRLPEALPIDSLTMAEFRRPGDEEKEGLAAGGPLRGIG